MSNEYMIGDLCTANKCLQLALKFKGPGKQCRREVKYAINLIKDVAKKLQNESGKL